MQLYMILQSPFFKKIGSFSLDEFECSADGVVAPMLTALPLILQLGRRCYASDDAPG